MSPGDHPSAWVRCAAAGGQRTAYNTARLSISRVFTPNSMHSPLNKSSQQVARGVSDPPTISVC
eukprot:3539730-Prymnesium_polylepis.1